MRVIHSLWSKPLLKNRWFLENQFKKSLYLYALSFLYLKERGFEVVLHTDDLGKELLSKIPYDAVHTTLNDLKNTHQKFWAAGKIKSLENEDLGVIHIDGDVFLKSDKILPLFKQKYDVLTQMVEGGVLFEKGYKPQMPYFDNALKNVTIEGYGYTDKAYNCGVLSFKNTELREQFVWNFETMVGECIRDVDIMFNMNGNLEPNIILEQHQLAGLTELKGYTPKFLLDLEKTPHLQNAAKEIGYVHAWGKRKYDDDFQYKVKKLILEKDKTLFKRL